MFRLLLIETRRLLRERVALTILALLVAACVLAFFSGRATIERQVETRAASAAEDAKTAAAFRDTIRTTTEPDAAILHAVRLTMPVAAPLPPLPDFSTGRAGFENSTTVVRLRSRPDTLFKRTQLDNPEMLARGTFDLAFVAILLAPLLLIALGYGVFAGDRDSGAARLILVQGTPTRVLAARGLLRIGLVFVPIAVTAALLVATGPDLAGRAGAASGWVALALLGLLFWWTVILLVNSLRIRAETAALSLIGLWALLTLVLPILIAASVQLINPPPSRFTEIAAARAAEIAETEAYENDHPDLASEDFAGRLASVRKSRAIGAAIDRATAPLAASFDAALARQQSLTRTLDHLAPPLVLGNGLAAIAGTDAAASLAFRGDTAAYLARLKNELGLFIDAGRPLSMSDYDALTRFSSTPRDRPSLWPAAYLALLTLIIGGAALFRFRRVSVD